MSQVVKYRFVILFMVVVLGASACSAPISASTRVREAVGAPLLAKQLPVSAHTGVVQQTESDGNASAVAVSATQPTDGAQDIDPATQIMVVFNQPVVPLTGVDDQASLPNPVTIDPQTEGNGRWINTSVYAFQPSQMLLGATEYTVMVDGVTAPNGAALAEPYSFTFTTRSPIVLSAAPTGDQVAPTAAISVTFSQPMDANATEQAFLLAQVTDDVNPAIDGAFSWDDAQQVLTFTPAEPLEFGQSYAINVSQDAHSQGSDGTLREAFQSNFSTVPYPDIESTTPLNGATNVSPESLVVIDFNTVVSRTQVMDMVTVAPLISNTYVYSDYYQYESQMNLSWFMQPNTQYTITIGGDISDDYGNTLGEDSTLTFTSGNYAPFVDLELDRFNHLSTLTEPRVSLVHRNVNAVDVSLYQLPEAELQKLTGEDQWQVWDNYTIPNPEDNLVWTRQYDTSGDENVAIRQIVTLTQESGDLLPTGAYFVEVNSPDLPKDGSTSQYTQQAVVILSDANLVVKRGSAGSSLVWLTDLASGKPISGAQTKLTLEGTTLASVNTGEDGYSILDVLPDPPNEYAPYLAISGEPGSPDYAVASSDWNEGISPWEFNLSQGYGPNNTTGVFYTERPIYRPGDTVYWKGIVRSLTGNTYQIPDSDLPINVTINDQMGNTLYEAQQTLNQMGTVNGELVVSPEAPTGYYYLSATIGAEGPSQTYTGTGFQVASYRKPEFEISISPSKPEYIQGESVVIEANASYFSGSPLANAPVTWRLIAEPYNFYMPNDDGPWYSFSPYDPDAVDYDPYATMYGQGLVTEGEGVTDAEGDFQIELDADISDSRQSQQWTFDVTVQSPTNQFVSGSASVPIHRAAFYIGLAPRSYVGYAGQQADIDIITVTPDHEPYPGAELTMTVVDYNWSSVYEKAEDGSYRWSASVERTPVYTTTVTTGRDGAAVLEWTPEAPGQYQIVGSGVDDDGNETSSVVYFWVSSDNENDYVAWPMRNNDRIDIVADKQEYAPGDVAKILVPSPFQGEVSALLTVEANGVLDAQVMTLTANSGVLEVPIYDSYLPNVYVSVILIKGVDKSNPFPAIRVGYTELTVDTSKVELTVEAESSATQVEPGDTVTYTLHVSDVWGNPVPNAEVSVAVVDKAVLSLSDAQDPTLLESFYSERPLGVTTGATLIINRDRVSQQLSESAKGGGGGGGGGGLEIRTDFADVAYWQADLMTDGEGNIEFAVHLPDSLTTWQMTAKAVTDDTHVGQTSHDVVATKQLQVRTITPRFLTAGDRPYLGAQVMNTTDQALTGVMTFTLQNGTIEGSPVITMPVEIDANGQTRQLWPVDLATEIDAVTVTAEAVALTAGIADVLADGMQIAIPVERYESPENVATSGEVPAAGVEEQIVLPAEANDSGDLVVRMEPNLASGMLGGLNYLEHYPYECNEQTVSRFLPNLVTVRALQSLGIQNQQLESQLSYQLGIGAQMLTSRQNPDGGWGYWNGEESNAFITAYVLWGLSLADEMGYTVPEWVIQSAVSYLDGQFESPATAEGWQLNEMAFMNYVLSEVGQGDPGRASTLYDVREKLDYYGKALLAMTLDNMSEDKSDPRVQTLVDDMVGGAVITATGAHWEEEGVDFETLNTNTRSTSMVLAALIQIQPDQPLLPRVVRWLMTVREQGHWSTTQENAWAIISLTDWMSYTNELKGDYTWTTTLNGEELGSGTVTPGEIDEPVQLQTAIADLLRDEANRLLFERSNDSGVLYYTTYLRYFLDASAIDSRDNGVIIDRRFETPDGNVSSSANVGDIVTITVSIIAQTDMYQLLVETPIPAGMEPLDPGLATTTNQAASPQMSSMDNSSSNQWWQMWNPTHTDFRDDKVVLFSSYMPAGTYEYSFTARASLPGEFRVLPAHAEMMYFPEVWGRSSGDLFSVNR